MTDADDLHLFNGHDLPRITRADPSDRVLTKPPANLRKGVLLRLVGGVGDFGVESGRD